MKHITIYKDRCKGCELCVLACPKSVLTLSHDCNESGYHYAQAERPNLCSGCLFCVKVCPDICLEIRNSK